MQRVFVLDAEQRPLMPCRPARARLLLTQHKAAVFRRFPFTIILKATRPDTVVAPLRAKLDPGSKTTGMAVVNDASGEVMWAAELSHRGQQVKEHLDQRRGCRHSRRARHTRYRPPRFNNRRRQEGWLPPSLESRLENILTWVTRLQRYSPVAAISMELVKFDTQLMQNAEISGIEYQQGTLAGYEIREYLLEKFGRRCVYCGKEMVPFEVEHIVPIARGGTSRISNLALACHICNQAKKTRTAAEFGHPEVQALAQAPMKDAAAVNASRWALYRRLVAMGLPVETGSGGRTKWNRTRRKVSKTHWLDACCVGPSTPEHLRWRDVIPLQITAQGWQRRQMCLVDAYGFPRSKAKERSRVHGFKTGDLVRATVPTGAKAGTYVGKVAVRARGYFNISTAHGVVTDISYRHCRCIQAADGYSYQKGERAFPPLP
jgi:5-methylcytosine-specific restriction endonuclease McrA